MILITGATGLLGSHLINLLTDNHTYVKALYRTVIPQGFPENIEWIKGDVLEVDVLNDVLKDVQQVYHCAAVVSFNPKKKNELFNTNVEGTTNVVNACLNAGVEKLLYVSSVAALGRIDINTEINEQSNWTEENSSSMYGKSKHLAEMQVWRGIAEGLNAVIINPVMIIGASDWDKSSTEIFKTIYKEFGFYTSGVTGIVDVVDVARAMIELMDSNISAERFIICNENVSFKKLMYLIATSFNKKPPHKKVTPLMAQIIWRAAAVAALFTRKAPLLTKETVQTAQAKVYFDNSKFLNAFPNFKYTPLEETIERICRELKQKYNL